MIERYPGRLNFYDTTLAIWEEPSSPERCSGLPEGYNQEFTRDVYEPLRGFLRRRGWTVERDPDGKHYKSIAKYMWQANHGDLRLKTQRHKLKKLLPFPYHAI